MIQVLGLRDFATQGKAKKRETFFTKGWRFERIQDVFDANKRAEILAKISDTERFNLYFTEADCFEESGRKLREQWAIPFDIDDIEFKDQEDPRTLAAQIASEAIAVLGLDLHKTPIVFSGNGVQFHVILNSPIVEESYFDTHREHYHVLATRIQNRLLELGLSGKVDTSVFSKGRLMRLPDTQNRKPGKPLRVSEVLQDKCESQDFDLVVASGITTIEKAAYIPDEVLKSYPKPDTKAVLEGCSFLVHCRGNQNKVSEPEWYAMTSITARLENGRELTHEYSQEYHAYNHYETEEKINQALTSAGPRTCKNIDTLWSGCANCPNYEKVTSPILIKGPDYIASKDFGYRARKRVDTDKGAKYTAGAPVYTDLIKEFTQLHPYKVVAEGKQVIIYNGKHWEFLNDMEINAWMTGIVRHEPNVAEMREFLGQLKSYNITSLDGLHKTMEGYLNFQNGVLDIKTLELHPHSPKYGFFEVRPFAYDATAEAPLWKKFLLDITLGDQQLADTLEEFGGYCISGDEYWLHKALLLVGDGANGKSVFMETLGQVVGPKSHSGISMQELHKDTMRYMLVNSLFNYSEETSVGALNDSELFKCLAAGGLMSVKQLYVQPYNVKNRAKLILSANSMPYSKDKSGGLTRRFAIVELKAKFKRGDGKHVYNMQGLLAAELPGICNSLIKAYKRLKEVGEFSGVEKLDEALKLYEEESDTVLMMLSSGAIEEQEGEFAIFEEVYDAYKNFCENNGFRPVNSIHFSRQVTKHRYFKVSRKRFNGAQKRGYEGLKLVKDF